MKKRFYIVLFLLGVVLGCIISGIFFICNENKDNIYLSTSSKVVEIKAETSDYGVSYGSGIIMNKDFTIVTNAHVVLYEKLSEVFQFEDIQVRFIYESHYRKCEIVKFDKEKDLAVLKLLENENLKTSYFSIKELKLMGGNEVYAIGNSNNHGISITKGIITMKPFDLTYDGVTRKVVQVDVTITSGNSGGALVNVDGNLLGITTFKLKDDNGGLIDGLCYCIPISEIREFLGGNV